MQRVKRSSLWCLTWTAAAVAFAPEARGGCSAAGLNDGPLESNCGTIEFDCLYTDDDPVDCNDSGDYFTGAQAQDVLDAVDGACGLYAGFGFAAPHQNTLPDFFIQIKDLNDASLFGVAYASCFEINSVAFRCDADDGPLRKTSQHELFHTIQRKYMCVLPDNDCDDDETGIGETFGKWVSEGTARCLDDRLYNDLDSATFGGSFWDEVEDSAIPAPETTLTELKYAACLFWSYCCEQLGDDTDEPERGIDFVKTFWERIEANATNDSLTALREAITAEGGGSLDDVFQGYAICNYTKDYDVSALPNSSKYAYVDEGQNGQADYGSVPVEAVGIPFDDINIPVAAYATRYFEAEVPNVLSCEAIGFRGESDQKLGWALVGVTADGRATVLSKGQGTEWGRTIIVSPTDPVEKITAVVAGLSNGDNFDYWFDTGPLTVSIYRPTISRQVYPGPAAGPGRFLARVFVEGPDDLEPAGVGQRSVLGLEAEDFSVTVGATAATVLSAAYVGGEYWLVVQAPAQAADGLYDLTVSLCEGAVSDTNTNAVLYATLKTNHMVVIDRSGSMANPIGNSKLAAAQIAAGLYVDSVSDADRLGVVAFDGNTVACDDDAVVLEALGDASAAKRAAARADIDALATGGATSIGDGLWKGQDQLDLFLADADYHTMVLLSDGEENEARYWDTVAACDTAASRIVPGDTVVNAIAFGPESNQTLMQDIADQTEGDYSFVDVSLVRTVGLSMINSLADAYMGGLQRARRLERLFFRTGTIGTAFLEFDIPVTEPNLQEATFFFNVADRGASLNVELRNPGGVLIGPAAARIYATTTHTVYHMLMPPMAGNWRARLTTQEPVEYIAGLVARNRFGAQMIARVMQVRQGGVMGELDEGLFESGVPVTLLAILTDAQGPILGAQVLVEIEQPDGDPGCGSRLLRDDGTQNDGAAGDGVYGLIFNGTWLGSRGGVNNDSTQQPPPGTRGSYEVTFHAEGLTNQGVPFERWADRDFQVYATLQDQDHDQLPDPWEKFYGTNPAVPDATLDSDLDGMGNRQEFEQGTHPLDADTDDDGELDGSEFNRGRCPLDPSDGLLPYPLDVEVVTEPGDEGVSGIRPYANLLRFPWHPAYQQMRIFRAVDAPVGLTLYQTLGVTPGRTGRYYDTGVVAGRAYFYQFQAVGAGGATSRRSKIIQGVPFAVPEDCDLDGDVDLTDANTHFACLTGPVAGIGTGCLCTDLIQNGHVDLRDAAAFQSGFPYP